MIAEWVDNCDSIRDRYKTSSEIAQRSKSFQSVLHITRFRLTWKIQQKILRLEIKQETVMDKTKARMQQIESENSNS